MKLKDFEPSAILKVGMSPANGPGHYICPEVMWNNPIYTKFMKELALSALKKYLLNGEDEVLAEFEECSTIDDLLNMNIEDILKIIGDLPGIDDGSNDGSCLGYYYNNKMAKYFDAFWLYDGVDGDSYNCLEYVCEHECGGVEIGYFKVI